MGAGDPHRRLRRRGDRRARLVLGRDRGRAARRRRARPHDLLLPVRGEASMYLLMVLVLLRAAARAVRRTHPEVRVSAMRREHRAAPDRRARARGAAVRARSSLGLPLRTAIDVVVFAIACMGAQHPGRLYRPRLVRPRRLVRARRLCGGARASATGFRATHPAGAVRARCSSRVARRSSGALILRRRGVYFSLLTLALTALLFAIALSLDRAHRRRERARRRHARDACSASISSTTWTYYGAGRGASACVRRAICSGASTARRSAACWSRSARTSSARASSAIRPTATS